LPIIASAVAYRSVPDGDPVVIAEGKVALARYPAAHAG
jgi:hypothetical protein